MGLSNQIPELKNELPMGIHQCVVTDASLLRDREDNTLIMIAGDYVVIYSFSCGGSTTQKAFKFSSNFDFKEHKKVLAILGIPVGADYVREDVIGQEIAVFVQKVINRESGEFTHRISNFKPAGKNYKNVNLEVYE